MDEFVKKEEKTYIIDVDSIDTEDTQDNHEAPNPIEVVTGNGKDLDISDVSEYLEVEKPKDEGKKENIIVPEEKK